MANQPGNESRDHLHTLLALEDPEAHLHPQTQRSLYAHIRTIPPPCWAGTVGGSAPFTKAKGSTTVAQIHFSRLAEPDDARKLQQKVLETRGELLFARAIVVFEGKTEEHALPVWAEQMRAARTHWSRRVPRRKAAMAPARSRAALRAGAPLASERAGIGESKR